MDRLRVEMGDGRSRVALFSDQIEIEGEDGRPFSADGDSGSLVIDVIAAGGKVDAPTAQRVFWCVFEGLVAIALILGGGLVALQAMAVSTGLPFTIVLLMSTVAVIKGLMSEPRVR